VVTEQRDSVVGRVEVAPESLLSMLNREVGFKCGVMAFAMLEAAALILINHFWFRFRGDDFVYPWLVVAIPAAFIVYVFTLRKRARIPRTAFFFETVWAGLLVMTLTVMMDTAVQLTPFPPIDSWILHIDQAMGYSTPAVLNWTEAHPWWRDVFNIAYHALDVQLAVVPLLLALLMERRMVGVLLNGVMFGSVIGFTIYYFWPTPGPAAVVQDPGFTTEQLDLATQFKELQSHEPLTSAVPGLVSFPSFHVFWAIVIMFCFWPRKWLFVPFLVLNSTVIVSTLALGWHFLFDVFGGAVLAGISIWVGLLTTRPRR
jgi:membrane-associated phospholipid phosphatase